jgi:alkaline phosphatase D
MLIQSSYMPRFVKHLRLSFVCFFFALGMPLFAVEIALGPMLGPVGMREARVWVQTTEPATVRLLYRAEGETSWNHASAPVATTAKDALTAELVADRVRAGTRYQYTIELDGRVLDRQEGQVFQAQPFFRDRAPAPDFTVAIGGSHYVTDDTLDLPYQDFGGGNEIFTKILEADPDWMLWTGNSSILREADASSLSGMLRRYEQSRNLRELRTLLRSRPHYANWSRRDFGPQHVDSAFIGRTAATHAFSRFWITPGRERELAALQTEPGRYSTFTWADVRFIFLDINSFRDESVPETVAPVLLGQRQLDWLRAVLASSKEPFKVIVAGAPLLNPARNPGNYSTFRSEHERFLRILREYGGNGLFFVNGGRDYGEFTRFVQSGHYDFHEITMGPLTAQPKATGDALNFFRQPGTYHEAKQFALLRFSGPEDARLLTVEVRAADGRTLWTRELSYDRLRN